MAQNALKNQSGTLSNANDKKKEVVSVDDAKRLKEIRAIVKNSNLSSLDDNLIICQVYMESRFNERSGEKEHSARGLMQMQRNAVRQVYKYRVKKNTGKSARDKDLPDIYAKADAFYNSEKIYEESDNIKIGTEYMQYWIDRNKNDIVQAYKDYRGKENGIYYNKIKVCADKLSGDPNNMQLLRDMVDVKK